MTPPVLTTARLCLLPPELAGFEAYAALFTSPRARWMGRLETRRQAWFSFAADIGTWLLRGFGPWDLRRRQDQALLGQVGLLQHDHFPEAELGWHLYEGFEGQGYAFEGAQAARSWAFGAGGLGTLVSYIHVENHRSRRLAERLGARIDRHAQAEDAETVVYRHPDPAEAHP